MCIIVFLLMRVAQPSRTPFTNTFTNPFCAAPYWFAPGSSGKVFVKVFVKVCVKVCVRVCEQIVVFICNLFVHIQYTTGICCGKLTSPI